MTEKEDIDHIAELSPGHQRFKPDFNAPIEIELDGIFTANLYFGWEQRTVGFGQCTVSLENGKLTADTECMSREWLRRALHALADTLADNAELE